MKTYIVKIGKLEKRFKSLKKARECVRSIINANEIKGIKETIEIYNETVTLKKIDEIQSNPQTFGTVGKIYA